MDIDRQTEAPESHGACFVPSRYRNLYSNGTYIQAKTLHGLLPADKIFLPCMNVCGGVTQSPVRLRKCQFSLICSSCTPKGSELDVYCVILDSHWTTLLVNATHLTEVL